MVGQEDDPQTVIESGPQGSNRCFALALASPSHADSHIARGEAAEFAGIANVTDSVARRLLKAAEWSVERALDMFYASGDTTTGGGQITTEGHVAKAQRPRSRDGTVSPVFDEKAVAALFDRYQDPAEQLILAEGTEALCTDLAVEPSDIVTIVLANHLGATRMCEFPREGWLAGWRKLGCDTIEAMRKAVVLMRTELDDPRRFKEIYEYAFHFAREECQKSLPIEVAIPMWQVLLNGRFPLLNDWCVFVGTRYKKSISKDSWNLLLDFVRTVNVDLSNYDEDGAWPVVIDEFVIHVRQKRAG